jgi:hypothetical protein
MTPQVFLESRRNKTQKQVCLKSLEMNQTKLINRIIKALRLEDGAKWEFTPSESKPLVKDVNGELASGAFCHSSVGV